MAPPCARLLLAALLSAEASGSSAGAVAESGSSGGAVAESCPAAAGAARVVGRPVPGIVLLQKKLLSASLGAAGRQPARADSSCASFGEWPAVDNGVTCIGCTALVSTVPHNRCDRYCESFGHVCTAAAEEVGDSCAVKHTAACDEEISGTSDMLCTCRSSTAPPVHAPAQLPSVCGSARSCEHCPGNEPPMHAGCFIVREGKLLAHRITYAGRPFDLPGGQSDWKEPASCTAHRETYEETGFEVTPTELLAGGLHNGGFNLYRCELLRDMPSKSPDHEVSGVWWLTREEVAEKVRQGLWRFPEASRYVEWMR